MLRVSSPHHILIVGAGPGIGTALAIQASLSRAHVTLAARSTDTLDASSLAVYNATASHAMPDPHVWLVTVDASDPVSLRDVLADHASRVDAPIDAALFNVSAWVPGGWDTDLGEVEVGLRTGVVSGLAMAQALIPTMRELPEATLLFTGGGTADHPMTASLGLGLQKSALRTLAQGLDADLAETSIRSRTLTIRGTIAPDTPFAPERIAAALWALCVNREGSCAVDFTGG